MKNDKLYLSLVSCFIILVVCLSLMVTPFIAAYQVVTHPIETTIDFVEGLIGSLDDILGIDDITIEDMNILISIFYEKTDEQQIVDRIVNDYESILVTPENLLIPFIFSQCDHIDEDNLRLVADFIDSRMETEMNTEKMVGFILSESPFKESCHQAKIDKDALHYLYSLITDTNNYIPEENTPIGSKIVGYAKSKIGARYFWGASGPKYFDCSGFVYWVHNQAGIKLIRTTAEEYSQMGKKISYSELMLGDVITFDYGSGVQHIGIYIGDGKMVHALGDGASTVGQYANQCVKISSIAKGSYFYKHLYNCRRLYEK